MDAMFTPLFAEEDCEKPIVGDFLDVSGEGTTRNKGPMETIEGNQALHICQGKEKRI